MSTADLRNREKMRTLFSSHRSKVAVCISPIGTPHDDGVLETKVITKSRAFPTLDAMRGVAALAVIQYHQWTCFGFLVFQRGYLAVDFFFLLSGFVLSFAYQERIDRGGFAFTFVKTRFARLYPLYFLGLLIGFGWQWVELRATPGIASSHTIVLLGLCGLILLPAPPSMAFQNVNAFPLNTPAWSLFGEAVANVLHVLFLKRRSTATLCVIASLLLAAVFCLSLKDGRVDFGWTRWNVYVGLTRVMFSYVLGMLVYRAHRAGRLTFAFPASVSCALLLSLLAIPDSFGRRYPVDVLCVALLFPALLGASINSTPSRSFAGFANLLGLASYAIYILHQPLERPFARLWYHLRGVQVIQGAPWSGIVFLVLAILLAVLTDNIYDKPVRRWLTNHFVRRNGTKVESPSLS